MSSYLQIKIEGDEIDLKLFISSEQFRKKILKAIQEDGISIFSSEWGHHPIKKLDK